MANDGGRQDKGEGLLDKAKGKVKEAVGDATNDESRKAEGQKDQLKGEGKQKEGDLKDRL